jgi:hypothetical protein
MVKTMVPCEGRYLYGVAVSGEMIRLGPIGIGGSEVYSIPYEGLSAIIHDCPAAPYDSPDENTVKNWVGAHQAVLDQVQRECGTVIPMGFDTILHSKDAAISPGQVVKDWLREDYKRLQEIAEKIKGKDEYGVQITYVPGLLAKQISAENHKLRGIREKIASSSQGTAYMYMQKLEKTIKEEMEKLAGEWFKDFYSRIQCHCDDIVVEKAKKLDGNKVMLLNLSCLVTREKVTNLGEELEKINNTEGFSVHFSGPWPPYSFVAKPAKAAPDGKLTLNSQ